MTVKVTLTTPITAHGKKIEEITLEEPKGKHIRRCGSPYSTEILRGGDVRIDFNSESIAKYVQELGNIPQTSVDSLSAADFMNLQDEVVRFFDRGAPKTPLTDSGSSQLTSREQETSSI